MLKGRILLVDDNKDFTMALSERLALRGLTVDIASSGLEAIVKATEQKYDAVVLDVIMPGMDGIETLKRMLADDPTLQVIILTGHASFKRGLEAMKFGAAEFLKKPVDFAMLMEKIKELIAKRAVGPQKTDEIPVEDASDT